MYLRNSRTTSVLLAALVLIGGANLAAYAATGGNFILGHTNSAGQPSTLVNTGSGPALKIKTKPGAAPLSVTSSKKVARLNADKLDGKSSAAFAPLNEGFTWHALTLAGTWVGNCSGGGVPAYAVRDQVVYLRGDLCSGGSNSLAFTLPAEATPTYATNVFLTADLANAAKGRVFIDVPTRGVYLYDDPEHTGAANIFTSLAGISFTK